LLQDVGARLDQVGVPWVILRDERSPGDRVWEIDLLTVPGSTSSLDAALGACGFVALRSYGRGTHRFYLAYDARGQDWLQLDVVTELAYGPGYVVGLEAAAPQCLERRKRVGGVWRLDERDWFWTMLLHCVLDKRVVTPDRRAALVEVAGRTDMTAAPLTAAIRPVLPPALSVDRLVPLVRDGSWDRVLRARAALLRWASRREPVRCMRRVAQTAVGRTLEKPRQFRHRRGLTVALLGPGGVGKSTVARATVEGFAFPARRIDMGRWRGTEQGHGRTPLQALATIAAGALRVWRRVGVAAAHAARGRLVVFDRYTYDALLPLPLPLPRTGSLRWLRVAYFRVLAYIVPRPDLVLVLDAPGAVVFRRTGARRTGESTPEDRLEEDRLEADRLEEERRVFLRLVERLGAQRVDASRPLDAVCADVTAAIWRRYGQRSAVRSAVRSAPVVRT
jgi:thymidylate kinase